MKTTLNLLLLLLGMALAGYGQSCPQIISVEPNKKPFCGLDSIILLVDSDSSLDFINVYYSVGNVPNISSLVLYDSAARSQNGIFEIQKNVLSVSTNVRDSVHWQVPQINFTDSVFFYAILGDMSIHLGDLNCRPLAKSAEGSKVRPSLAQTTFMQDTIRICEDSSLTLNINLTLPLNDPVLFVLSNTYSDTIPVGATGIVVELSNLSGSQRLGLDRVQYLTPPNCAANSTDSIVLLVRPDLSDVKLTGDETICTGDSHTVSLSNIPASDTDIWVEFDNNESFTVPSTATGPGSVVDFRYLPIGNNTLNVQEIRYTSGPACSVNSLQGSATITIRPSLMGISLTGDKVCAGDSATISIGGLPTGFGDISLDLSGSNFPIIVNSGESTFSIFSQQTITYSLSNIQYSLGPLCPEALSNVTATVEVVERPVASFMAEAATVCYSNPTCVLNASTGDDLSYTWDFAGEYQSTEENPCRIIWQPAPEQVIRLKVVSGFGCTDSTEQTVSVDFDGPAPAQVMRIRKTGDESGVLLVAQDTVGQKDQIEYYEWFTADGQSISGKIPEDFYFHTDVEDSVYVVTKLIGNACEARSFLSRKRNDLDPTDENVYLKAFPNPSQGTFTLLINGPMEGAGQLVIHDVMGRTVWEQAVEKNQLSFQLKVAPDLSRGTYLLTYVHEDNTLLQFRLLIQ